MLEHTSGKGRMMTVGIGIIVVRRRSDIELETPLDRD